jgi:hypothetical protein
MQFFAVVFFYELLIPKDICRKVTQRMGFSRIAPGNVNKERGGANVTVSKEHHRSGLP